MEYGSDRFAGFVVCWTRFLLSVADRDRRGVRNRQFWHLGVFADLGWAARCWKMDRVAKRFCKPGRCGRTGAHWVYRGLDWTLSSGAGDNGGGFPAFWDLMGVFCWSVLGGFFGKKKQTRNNFISKFLKKRPTNSRSYVSLICSRNTPSVLA